ncbi:energy transducer TonB [Arcticibacterium luteifluviistationis]|uniref:Uncharacterized protein n=1 Tax=Arcticibacterium luteifluviistationis TaxID=1784714 RepID=A0A2Z4G8Q9_9BACT|nr:energy transducer TonB [Arcticibacterium luteifluviistationis]AWV97495.1 hypothetical protein DJ013_04660 [Arcticibacterium luteifluviistationis]
MTLRISILLFFISSSSFSQFTLAQFEGGEDSLKAYIERNLKPYKELNTILQLRIDSTGKVTEADILNSTDYEVDEAILKMANEMPNSIPAIQGRQQISSIRMVPIQFEMSMVYTAVEQNPSFPGGREAMDDFFNLNMGVYEPKSKNTKTAMIRFTVLEDGKTCCTIFFNETPKLIEEQILKALNKMPLWNPGKQNNRLVKVFFTMPVKYVVP